MENAQIERVKDLLLTLVKAQRDYKTYPRNNPILLKRRVELHGKFEALLSQVSELVLKVEPESLLYDDQPVFTGADRRDSIAFSLYRNGIREIRFTAGLTPDEVDGLIESLNLEFVEDESDDDLITVLWTRDLPHLRYDAVDDVDPRLDWVRDPSGVLHEYIVKQRELPGDDKFGNALRLLGGKPAQDLRADIGAVMLSPEEIATVRALLDEDAKRDLGLQVIEILMEVLRANPDPAQARNLLRILERVVDLSIEQRSFNRAATTLRVLTQLERDLPALANTLRGTIAVFTDVKSIRKLLEVIVRPVDEWNPPVDELDLFRYLSLLTKSAAVPLAEGLGTVEDRRLRKVLCEALAELVKTDIGLLAGLSRDNRWFVARNIAYVLGLTKNPEALKILRSLAIHAHEKVRSEALRGAAMLGQGAKDIVHRGLGDSDRSVRMLAMDLIAPFADASTPALLLAALQDKGFEEKDVAEKRALFSATVRVAGEHALAPLSVLLLRRRLLASGTNDETRIAAAAAIAAIGTPNAADYLKQCVASGDEGLVAICEQALREAKLA